MLALIFAAGVVTGRYTAPQQTRVVQVPAGRTPTAKMILENFKAQVSMTPEEELKMMRFLEQVQIDIAPHEPLSKERLEIFRRSIPKMKEILSSDKHAAVDRYAAEMERRIETVRKRRGLDPQ